MSKFVAAGRLARYLLHMLTNNTAPMTGGANQYGLDGAAASLAESLPEPDVPHDGGLDLYDVDEEY